MHVEFLSKSETDTDRLGMAIVRCVPPATVVALIGTLGAGKTRLVQAIASASGIAREDVVSPTFTLSREYDGSPAIVHLDWYRVADEDELEEIGWQEISSSSRLILVEWADRFPQSLPTPHLHVEIDIDDSNPSSRQFRICMHGPDQRQIIAALTTELQ